MLFVVHLGNIKVGGVLSGNIPPPCCGQSRPMCVFSSDYQMDALSDLLVAWSSHIHQYAPVNECKNLDQYLIRTCNTCLVRARCTKLSSFFNL